MEGVYVTLFYVTLGLWKLEMLVWGSGNESIL